MEKLHVSFMRDLINIDFERVYFLLIEVMDNAQVDEPDIQYAYAQIKPHVNKFDALRDRTRNKLCILNEKLTRTRTDYLISLRLRVKSYMRSHIPEERVAAERIYFVLKEYGKKYYVPNILSQTVFVDGIVFHMKKYEDFKEAFTLLGLKDLMDVIAEMTEEIMTTYRISINENQARKHRNNGVRDAAYKDIKIMIDTMNSTYSLNRVSKEEKANIQTLMRRIDGIFTAFRTQMRSQQTKRRNKKAVVAAVQELTRTQQEPQKLLPVGVSQELKTTDNVGPSLRTKERMGAAGATSVSGSSALPRTTANPESGVNEIKPNSKNSSITRKGKGEKGDKSGRGKLPPNNLN